MKKIILVVLALVLASWLLVRTPKETYAAANGRFGVAIGTWNYSKVQCYDHLTGARLDCSISPVQMNRRGFSDMLVTSYDGLNLKIAPGALNISSFETLDPSANTQFIWFHYEDTNNPLYTASGKFQYTSNVSSYSRLGRAMTNEELWRGEGTTTTVDGAEIYATSGAPGAVRVKLSKEPVQDLPVAPACKRRTTTWRLRLPGIVYIDGYPYCPNCIFNKDSLFQFLDANQNFNDGYGNGYAFYMLAETEYGIPSHYLEPYEYAAVMNTYVSEIKSHYPKARFMLESPVGGAVFGCRYESYLRDLYDPQKKLLTPQAKEAIVYNALDIFSPPPPGPDTFYNGYPAVIDSQLQTIANQLIQDASQTANYLYGLNGKLALISQVGIRLYGAVQPVPNSIDFGAGPCPSTWCKSNTDVWKATEYGSARLAQLIFSQLARKANDTKIAAWAYWGDMEQQYWTEPLIKKTWGDINHGVYWLSWPQLCTQAAGCPVTTNQPWPTRVGMVYLEAANGNYNYVPPGAPSWWPSTTTSTCNPNAWTAWSSCSKTCGGGTKVQVNNCATPRTESCNTQACTLLSGDLNGDGHVNDQDLLQLLANFTSIYDYNSVVANFGK